MKHKIEIQAVDLVRRIRDAQATQLADKSVAEVMQFFNQAAERARKRGARSRSVRKSRKESNKALQPTSPKTRRG